MAEYCRNISDPHRPCLKIIRREADGSIVVNDENVGDTVGVIFLLAVAKPRFKARRISPCSPSS
jgi:hypothetical protein